MKNIYIVRLIKPNGRNEFGESINQAIETIYCSTAQKAWAQIVPLLDKLPPYLIRGKPERKVMDYQLRNGYQYQLECECEGLIDTIKGKFWGVRIEKVQVI